MFQASYMPVLEIKVGIRTVDSRPPMLMHNLCVGCVCQVQCRCCQGRSNSTPPACPSLPVLCSLSACLPYTIVTNTWAVIYIIYYVLICAHVMLFTYVNIHMLNRITCHTLSYILLCIFDNCYENIIIYVE